MFLCQVRNKQEALIALWVVKYICMYEFTQLPVLCQHSPPACREESKCVAFCSNNFYSNDTNTWMESFSSINTTAELSNTACLTSAHHRIVWVVAAALVGQSHVAISWVVAVIDCEKKIFCGWTPYIDRTKYSAHHKAVLKCLLWCRCTSLIEEIPTWHLIFFSIVLKESISYNR